MNGYGYGKRGQRGRRGRTQMEATLDSARPGERFEVVEIGDAGARMNALRFGMAEGAHVSCVTKVPAGPVVLRSGRQEIAVGRGLARRIRVRRLGSEVRSGERL